MAFKWPCFSPWAKPKFFQITSSNPAPLIKPLANARFSNWLNFSLHRELVRPLLVQLLNRNLSDAKTGLSSDVIGLFSLGDELPEFLVDSGQKSLMT